MPQIYHEGKFLGDGISGHNIINASGNTLPTTNKLKFNNASVLNVGGVTEVNISDSNIALSSTMHIGGETQETVQEALQALKNNSGGVVDVDLSNQVTGILPIVNGGTGNSDGYIRTGQQSGTTVGTCSTVEGTENSVSGYYSHAEGHSNTVTGNRSHAEGFHNTVSGHNSHAEGYYNIAAYENQTAIGKFNSNGSTRLFEVGNGTGSSARSNAFEVYSDGHINVNGDIYQNGVKKGLGSFISSIHCNLGDTSKTVTNSDIHATSLITLYGQYDTTSAYNGKGIEYDTAIASEGSLVITFYEPLPASADLVLQIINL